MMGFSHGLLFTAPEHTAELKEVMEDYATREDAEELTGKSGKQPRFELKPIDPALGSEFRGVRVQRESVAKFD